MPHHDQPNRFFANAGRLLVFVGFLALLGAWLTEITGGTVLGMSQQHLFFDAIALTVLGIALMADAVLHGKQG